MAVIQINRDPSRKESRTFALVWLVFFAGAAGLLAWRGMSSGVIGSLAGVAGLAPVLFLLWPPGLRGLYLGMCYAAYPIGWVVSVLLLALLYYAMITPVGVVMRALGRDPLERAFEKGRSSYWIRRAPAPAVERYTRQF